MHISLRAEEALRVIEEYAKIRKNRDTQDCADRLETVFVQIRQILLNLEQAEVQKKFCDKFLMGAIYFIFEEVPRLRDLTNLFPDRTQGLNLTLTQINALASECIVNYEIYCRSVAISDPRLHILDVLLRINKEFLIHIRGYEIEKKELDDYPFQVLDYTKREIIFESRHILKLY